MKSTRSVTPTQQSRKSPATLHMLRHTVTGLKSAAKGYKSLIAPEAKVKLSRHCVATVVVKDPAKLTDSEGFMTALRKILAQEDVQCLGELSHSFYNDSFTTVVALAESHISVHTWPERFVVQLDVFLCNYINDNTAKCERIFNAIIDYFDAKEIESTFIDRL